MRNILFVVVLFSLVNNSFSQDYFSQSPDDALIFSRLGRILDARAMAMGNANSVLSDNQVKVYTLWDSKYFYFAYDVTDSNLETQNQSLWQDDGIEIFLDINNDKTTRMDSNDFHIMMAFYHHQLGMTSGNEKA